MVTVAKMYPKQSGLSSRIVTCDHVTGIADGTVTAIMRAIVSAGESVSPHSTFSLHEIAGLFFLVCAITFNDTVCGLVSVLVRYFRKRSIQISTSFPNDTKYSSSLCHQLMEFGPL